MGGLCPDVHQHHIMWPLIHIHRLLMESQHIDGKFLSYQAPQRKKVIRNAFFIYYFGLFSSVFVFFSFFFIIWWHRSIFDKYLPKYNSEQTIYFVFFGEFVDSFVWAKSEGKPIPIWSGKKMDIWCLGSLPLLRFHGEWANQTLNGKRILVKYWIYPYSAWPRDDRLDKFVKLKYAAI